MSVAWVGVAATVGSAVLGASASSNAADAQAKSAADSTAAQKEMFDKQVQLQEPFRQTGLAANNELAFRLGLAPRPGGAPGGAPGSSGVPAMTYDQARSQLLPQFTSNTGGWVDDYVNGNGYMTAGKSSVDEDRLNSAIEQMMQQNAGSSGTAGAGGGTDSPEYGSLLRNFTSADMNADPVYQSGLQFGLNEGEKGINRQAAATGSSLSGATLKALTRFGNDYGTTKANESFNRFNVNQDRTYNKLAGVSGAGQQATNQVGAAAQNFGVNAGNNITSAGNARAAGYIGGANAISGGVGQAINGWQNNNLMNRIFPNGGGGNGVQAAFSNTGLGSSGFGTGLAYGNQDYGQFI